MLLRQRCTGVEPAQSDRRLLQHLFAVLIKLQSDQEIDKRAFEKGRPVRQREVARRGLFDVVALHVRKFLLPDAEVRLVIVLPEVPVEITFSVFREIELLVLGQGRLKRVDDVDPVTGEIGVLIVVQPRRGAVLQRGVRHFLHERLSQRPRALHLKRHFVRVLAYVERVLDDLPTRVLEILTAVALVHGPTQLLPIPNLAASDADGYEVLTFCTQRSDH